MQYTEQLFDQAMRLLIDAKLHVFYWRATGAWYWSPRSEMDDQYLDDWQGPFTSYFKALADAVAPYALKTYFVIYRDSEAMPLDVDIFECQAIDYEHACDQCQDAYPEADVLWADCGKTAKDVMDQWLNCGLGEN